MTNLPKILFSLLAFLAFCSLDAIGQTKTKLTILNTKNLPRELKNEKYEGIFKNAVQWTDKNGVNIVITSETGVYQRESNEDGSGDGGGSYAELFAWHHIINNNTAELTWKVTDFIKDCPVDIEAHFIPNAFTVTDLNKDGISEVWLMYVTVCHGDVSPLDMKIIMYEGTQKFAMRGQNKIKFSPTEYMGGEYKFDEAFTKGPVAFRDFAKKMWKQHIMGK